MTTDQSHIDQLRAFLAVADEGDYSRAANAIHVSRATVQSSIAALEADRAEQLIEETDDGEGRFTLSLTEAGLTFRREARARVAAAPPPPPKAGGKAKASKGRGRAPVVKGEPKPFKKRQGR